MIIDKMCIELFYEGENMISLNHKPILFKKIFRIKNSLTVDNYRPIKKRICKKQ